MAASAAVHGSLGELVMGADMIEMGMAGDGQNRSFGQEGDLLPQAYDAHAGIDQQVAVAPAHMPDIAAIERLDVRFPDMGHAVVERARLIPGFSRRDLHSGAFRPGVATDYLTAAIIIR